MIKSLSQRVTVHWILSIIVSFAIIGLFSLQSFNWPGRFWQVLGASILFSIPAIIAVGLTHVYEKAMKSIALRELLTILLWLIIYNFVPIALFIADAFYPIDAVSLLIVVSLSMITTILFVINYAYRLFYVISEQTRKKIKK